MFRRRYSKTKPKNNQIIYIATSKVIPFVTTGWGSNYLDSESTWDSTTGIGYLYFDGDITLIPDSAFEQNSTMISILHIPETVTSIGKRAFYFNESGTALRSTLTNVNFSNRIEIIGARAFQQNRQLEKAILPNSVEYIYEYAFNGCAQKLNEVTIGENFKKFLFSTDTSTTKKNHGTGCFGLCKVLKTIHWNAIDCEHFLSDLDSPFTPSSMGITTPPITTVTFGKKVKNIPNYLFYGCSNLTGTIELPETLEKINNTCFYKTNINKVIWNALNITTRYAAPESPFSLSGMGQTTSSIKYVRFGENVNTIPCALFWKCENITNDIVIPESVTTIGDRAFQACHGIKHVICRSITPPNMIPQDDQVGWSGSSCNTNVVFKYYNNGWYNLQNLEIYVPEISLNSYKNDANWSVYTNELKPIPQSIFDNFNGIDLGLKDEYGEPIIFADKNIGANNPEDIGYYFQWGDETGYSEENIINNIKQFDWSTYKYSYNGTTTMTKYNSTDNETKLRLCDDGAFMYTGGKWRMPTINELMLLTDETKIKIELVNLNDDVVETPMLGNIKGLRFTSKISGYEGNSIFIPAGGTVTQNRIKDVHTSGSIWASNVSTTDYMKCDALYFAPQNDNLNITKSTYERFYGRQIRGVLIK